VAYLTLDRLVGDDGEVDPVVLRHMVRRRCLNEYGVIVPRSLRLVIAHYREVIRVLVSRQQEKMNARLS
jgi:hypothetical protein